jgi:hypothetical protein
MSKKPIIELVLTDEEAEIFAVARAAGDGLRRSFDAWVSIGRATQIARKHADAPGGTHRTRGARFRAILDEQGLTPSYRHCTPVRLSRAGCSRQFGRASAPIIPHRVHTIRGPNDGTGMSSATGPRSRSSGGGTANTTPRATARRWRACCRASWAARPEIVVVCSCWGGYYVAPLRTAGPI